MEVILLSTVAGLVWNWIRQLGGPGLILLGLADSAPFMDAPAGSVDAIVIVLSAANHDLWAYYALMATIGEVAGGYLTYRVAAKGGQETLEKKVGKSRAGKIYRQFEKHGLLTLFAGSILPPPFPFTPVLVTAGVMQYPRRKFLSALTIGRALRFLTAAFLGRTYGPQVVGFFSRHYQLMVYIFIALAVVAGIGLLIYFGFYRSRKRKKQEQRQKGLRS
jgi:membrane protein YqaA with SNARE-associated domain